MNALAFNASPLVTRRGEQPDAQREELVVVSSPFFPHKLVTGYGNRFGSVIYSINKVPVRSLRHLVALLRDLKDELVVIHSTSAPAKRSCCRARRCWRRPSRC